MAKTRPPLPFRRLRRQPRHQLRYRPATVYVAVLGVAMIVSVMGLCGMHMARLQLKAASGSRDRHEARILALSAVDHAVSMMHYNSNWRTAYDNDVEVGPYSFGGNTFSWKLVDEDGDLADDSSDPLWIHGIGRVGDAVWVTRARARIDGGLPLEFLRTAIHCARDITIKNNKTLTATGASVSTDSELDLDNHGTVDGDAEAVTTNGHGTVTGTFTVPAERKGVPPRSLFDNYVARATQIPYTDDLDEIVLAPGVNEYGGGLNADGVYYINTSGEDLDIKKFRIHGTLLIDAGPDGKVVIKDECFIHPYRDDFPTLIIKAEKVELELKSDGGTRRLGEDSASHNFNPAGAPYGGQADTDQADSYPSEIRGLVHVIGELKIKEKSLVRGCVVVHGKVKVDKDCTFIHDPNLMLNPPLGYTDDPDSTKMIIEARSWTRQPAP